MIECYPALIEIGCKNNCKFLTTNIGSVEERLSPKVIYRYTFGDLVVTYLRKFDCLHPDGCGRQAVPGTEVCTGRAARGPGRAGPGLKFGGPTTGRVGPGRAGPECQRAGPGRAGPVHLLY